MSQILNVFYYDGSIATVDLLGAKTWNRNRSRPYPFADANTDGWFDLHGVRYYFDAVIKKADVWIMRGRNSKDSSGTLTAYHELYPWNAAQLLTLMGVKLPTELKDQEGWFSPPTREQRHFKVVHRVLSLIVKEGKTYVRHAAIPGYLISVDHSEARATLAMLGSAISQFREGANVNHLANSRAFRRLEGIVHPMLEREDWVPTAEDIGLLEAVLLEIGGPLVETEADPVPPMKLDELLNMIDDGRPGLAGGVGISDHAASSSLDDPVECENPSRPIERILVYERGLFEETPEIIEINPATDRIWERNIQWVGFDPLDRENRFDIRARDYTLMAFIRLASGRWIMKGLDCVSTG